MSVWGEQPLLDLVEFGTGKLNSNAAIDGGLFPFFTCSPETLRIDKFAFDCEALLLAGNNADGNFALKYYSGKFNAYQRTYVLTIPDEHALSYKYLFYALKTKLVELRNISGGSATKFLTLSILNGISIFLPEVAEQKAIAAVLSSLDDKIDLLHRQNKTLEAMAGTLFRQWFVEDTGADRLEGTVADLVDFNPSRKLPKGSVAPYLEMASLSNATFSPDGWYDRVFSSGTKFINGDTLLARITPCLENGKSAYVTFLEDGQVGWGSTEYIVMRPKKGLHSFFAYALARNRDFRDYAEGCLAGSSGRQRVDINHLMNYELKTPSTAVANEFNAFAESVTPKLHANSLQIRTLETLRDTLLPKLMSGEVRVAYGRVAS